MIITNSISMYRIFLLLIAIILGSISVESLFAGGCDDIRADLPESSEIVAAAEQCITARKSWNPNSITDFVCPQGSFFASNQQSITPETVAYLVAVQISFNKIDTDITKYMRQLQKTREADPVKWVESINSCTEKIQGIYSQICGFGTLESKLNENKDKLHITTTNAYPQTLCSDLASKKIAWWQYLQKILMSDDINKNQKNSTDTWVTEVKWGYARILASWHTYQKILARAVSKMTTYTKESN